MKKIYFFILFFVLIINSVLFAQITYTWTNAGLNNLFSDPANWSPPVGPPGPSDNVLFDGTSSDDCILDMSPTVSNFSMMSGYNGIFDGNFFSNNLTVKNILWVESGTFLTPNVLTFQVPNSSSTGTFYIGGTAVLVDGGVYIDLQCADNSTIYIDADGLSFNHLRTNDFGTTFASGQRNFNFASALPPSTKTLTILGTNVKSYQGTVKIIDNLRLNSTSTLNPVGSTGTFVIDQTGNKTINGSLLNRCKIPNLVLGSSAVVFNITNQVNVYNATITHSISSSVSGTHSFVIHGNCTLATPPAASNTPNRRFKCNNLVIMPSSTLNMVNKCFTQLSGTLTNNGVLAGSSESHLFLNGSGNQNITGSSSSATLGAIFVPNSASARNININTGVLILDSVKIGNNINLNANGNLALHSSNALKGRISELGSGAAISGSIMVRTFAPGGNTGWTNLGVSGVSGKNLSAWDGQIPMTCNGCIHGTLSAGGPFISVYKYNEPGSGGSEYVPMSATDPLNPGEGYWVYLGNGQTTTSDMTWTVSGPAVQGSVTVNLTKTIGSAYPGFNLIANPYPCPVRFRELMQVGTNTANTNPVIYIYNPDLGLTTSYNGNTNISSHTNGAQDVIPMGQGFYLEALSNTSFVFAEAAKTNSNTSSFSLLKTSAGMQSSSADDPFPPQKASYIRLSMKSNQGAWDETVVHFHPNASVQEDLLDAKKIFPNSFNTSTTSADPKKANISTRSANKYFSINSLPVSVNGYTIPVLAKTPVSGVFTITASELVDIPQGVCVELKDKYMNVTHNLLNGPYVFNLHDSTQAPRFELKVCGGLLPTGVDNPLPSQASSFVKILKGDGTIYFSGTYLDGCQITITNLLGQVLYENKKVHAPDNSFELPFRSDEKLIIVTVQTKNEKVTRKFVQ